MNINKPDFYLASTECYSVKQPRRCWIIGRAASDKRDDLLLVKVDPPILDENANQFIDKVILASRHVGESVLDLKKTPVAVYVIVLQDRPLPETVSSILHVQGKDIVNMAWAEVYLSESEAKQAVGEK